jgi:hypothetical protein
MPAVVSHARSAPPRVALTLARGSPPGVWAMLDTRGSGLLFFMFIRPQPYTCLGSEWSVRDPAGVPCTGAQRAARSTIYLRGRSAVAESQSDALLSTAVRNVSACDFWPLSVCELYPKVN